MPSQLQKRRPLDTTTTKSCTVCDSTIRGSGGFTSSFANFATDLCVELYQVCQNSNWERAWEIHWTIKPFLKVMAKMHGDFRYLIKKGQEMIGLYGGPVLPPGVPATAEDLENIEKAIRASGIAK